jgi:hypothetical protein
VTTVHVRQGRYADEEPTGPSHDIVVARIADVMTIAPARLLGPSR